MKRKLTVCWERRKLLKKSIFIYEDFSEDAESLVTKSLIKHGFEIYFPGEGAVIMPIKILRNYWT